jgi:hypothetical protein
MITTGGRMNTPIITIHFPIDVHHAKIVLNNVALTQRVKLQWSFASKKLVEKNERHPYPDACSF